MTPVDNNEIIWLINPGRICIKKNRNGTLGECHIRNRGGAIDTVSNCKYLGHCINDKLIDDDDMARQRKQIYAQGNALIRKFYMCTETVRISLFKSYCSLYTSSLWCNYRSESLQKLCVAYNNVLKKITFLPRDCSASLMFPTRNLPTCKTLIRKHAYIFMKSAA